MSAYPNPPELFTLQASDAEWLAALHRLAFPPAQAWGMSMLADALRSPAAIGLGLRMNNAPLAFILANGAADEAEILTLVTHPAELRKGNAALLLRALAETLTKGNIKKIFLEVAIDNIPAIELYRQFGFKNISIRKKYYRHNGHDVDAIVMRHDLA